MPGWRVIEWVVFERVEALLLEVLPTAIRAAALAALERSRAAEMGDGPRALMPDADAALLEVGQADIHHRCHEGVGAGVVLVEGR